MLNSRNRLEIESNLYETLGETIVNYGTRTNAPIQWSETVESVREA